jgi:glutathione S-transferase
MLMLEHKGIAYRRVDLPTGPHPAIVRLRGFPGHPTPIRRVDGRTNRSLARLDRLGTVPALRFGAQRIQTNRDIARFLDREQPDPPLFPADPPQRDAVEEAERWGDEVLQMAARPLALAAVGHGFDTVSQRGNDGRLGPLLAPREWQRRVASRTAARFFEADPNGERTLLDGLRPMLDTIDGWIAAGVLNGHAPNAADFTIAPSLALIAYRNDVRPQIEARPAGALMDRFVPEPSAPARPLTAPAYALIENGPSLPKPRTDSTSTITATPLRSGSCLRSPSIIAA